MPLSDEQVQSLADSASVGAIAYQAIGLLRELDEWRNAVESGARPGPRIYRAGPMVNGKAFNEFQIAVEDEQQARGSVRALQKAGVDFIKVHAAISGAAYRGVKAEADRLGIGFAGHIPRAVSPEEASNAGQVTMEHVQAFVDRFSRLMPPDDVAQFLTRFRRDEAPRLFDLFAKNGNWFTPTLNTTKAIITKPPKRARLRRFMGLAF